MLMVMGCAVLGLTQGGIETLQNFPSQKVAKALLHLNKGPPLKYKVWVVKRKLSSAPCPWTDSLFTITLAGIIYNLIFGHDQFKIPQLHRSLAISPFADTNNRDFFFFFLWKSIPIPLHSLSLHPVLTFQSHSLPPNFVRITHPAPSVKTPSNAKQKQQ